MRAVPRSALVEGTIERLRSAIVSGEWPMGSKIPTEDELVERLQVSRSTLRQAVQALVYVGLLETAQGRGTFVRGTHEVDAVLTRYLAEAELVHVLQTRRGLEVEAAGLAAEHRTRTDLDRLAAVHERQMAALRDGRGEEFNRAAVEFHLAVVEAAGNPVLARLYGSMLDSVRASVRLGGARQPREHHEDPGHARVLKAIGDGDPQAARDAAAEHVTTFLTALSARGNTR
ncbi:DNA-binding transcriptional regulator, FadR family [Streptoalloteichus tenebrarius]|uniref:DNA-binding transcriptional regulator, FadR family n=1 Tax=Streptoalloteichus tenebrarius (strain ATCC 17920 / DSM 40477 / JCM 4838 / CBS 697.72 / NBRC 16177 / NCIMB 11028 / NRRL B-12390 / A12253. 1 / ISP 5477) TaxID=1933 RepID=A0ABT1HQ88_STRSD|nr:FadR/GntR family transcriptional regulator [Streptoalloteichus tenebrarius]MCP2257681.1 DNA-binding transcriptional regulator, FadR family [Streptoalloteichus tenebrarius]BFE98641.1 FadR/GntR family transcriptional regulator [Streptoalloteichus tenebrarius]